MPKRHNAQATKSKNAVTRPEPSILFPVNAVASAKSLKPVREVQVVDPQSNKTPMKTPSDKKEPDQFTSHRPDPRTRAREMWSAVNQIGPNISPGQPDAQKRPADAGRFAEAQEDNRANESGRGPKGDKTQVQGNRQGGGDQRGKSNRPAAGLPEVHHEAEKLRRLAGESRDARGARKETT
jgi:hypothetical protein